MDWHLLWKAMLVVLQVLLAFSLGYERSSGFMSTFPGV